MRPSTSAWLATLVLFPVGFIASRAEAACTFGGPNGEPTLQQSFDTLINPATGSINAAADCLADGTDAAWTVPGEFGGATVVLELAGNAGSNLFGVYDLTNPNNRIDIFQGIDAAGDSALLELIANPGGGYTISITEDQQSRSLSLTSAAFGFYLQGGGGTLFSHSSDNAGGADYMYAYQGDGVMKFRSGPFSVRGTIFDTEDYMLAWEDLPNGDRDYQDFMVLMRSVTPAPVPVPAAAWLLISGLAGLTGIARRRRNA